MRVRLLESEEALEAIAVSKRAAPDGAVQRRVGEIVSRIREGGAPALAEIASELGDSPPEWLPAGSARLAGLAAEVPSEGAQAMRRARERIRDFAAEVMGSIGPAGVERDGCRMYTRLKPVESVCCYAPGGRYPLFSSALMTAVPARTAGVGRLTICTPRVTPEMALACRLCGADGIAVAGGAQAVAAAAYGVRPLSRTHMLAGPGNAWVTEAKRQLSWRMGTDMPAGPSEVVILADAKACAEAVALDLLAQAEHAPDASAWLLTDSRTLAKDVVRLLQNASELCPGAETDSLGKTSIAVLDDMDLCCRAAEALAPEHLEVQAQDAERLLERVSSFGAAFCGSSCCVAMGDYAAGPSHTLPTGRAARFASALSPLTFLRLQTVVACRDGGSRILADSAVLAGMEGMAAHALSCRVRLPAGEAGGCAEDGGAACGE